MPFAFTHLFFGWVAGKILEKITNKKLDRIGWSLLLFSSIIPDFDFSVEWIFNVPFHRTFTHSIFFIILCLSTVFLIYKILKRKKPLFYCSLVGGGVLIHIFLDMLFYPGVRLLWPLKTFIFFTDSSFPFQTFAMSDMYLALLWGAYLWSKKKIEF